MSKTFEAFYTQYGVSIDPSPPHAHQSNGTAERLIQELWARTRVLQFASKLPASLWAEAMNHSNWLRNWLPFSRIDNNIPILLWDSSKKVEFSKVPVFGLPGFALSTDLRSSRTISFLRVPSTRILSAWKTTKQLSEFTSQKLRPSY